MSNDTEHAEWNENAQRLQFLDGEYAHRINHECMTGEIAIDQQKADEILLDLLSELGFAKVIDVYCKVWRWE